MRGLANALGDVGRRYKYGNLRIERFVADGITNSSAILAKKHLRGNEGHGPLPLQASLISSSTTRLVEAIRARNPSRVYQSVSDLGFAVEYNQPAASPRATAGARKEFAKRLLPLIEEHIKGSDSADYAGRRQLFQMIREETKKNQDSSLHQLLAILISFQGSIFGRARPTRRLGTLIRKWANAWVDGDVAAQYDAIASITSLAQSLKPYGDSRPLR